MIVQFASDAEILDNLYRHFTLATSAQQRRARIEFAFISRDRKIALMESPNPDQLWTLPKRKIDNPNQLFDFNEMSRFTLRNLFFGGRKTPLDSSSVSSLGVAEFHGEDKKIFDMIVPVLGRMNTDAGVRELEPAVRQGGNSPAVHWVPIDEAINTIGPQTSEIILNNLFIMHAVRNRMASV